MDLHAACTDYQRIAHALQYLHTHRDVQPDLESLARELDLSPWHAQRLFTRWAGVSPKRFLQYLSAHEARRLLLERRNVLEVADTVGLSGGSRLHDLVVNALAVTPGELGAAGAGLQIRYGFHPSPFGECLLACTDRGICHLAFVEQDGRADALAALAADWPKAVLREAPRETAALAARVFGAVAGRAAPLALLLRGTNFQLQVWRALLDIPEGKVTTYAELARAVGQPGAARAVGQAVGSNRIAWLIPCHRVIRALGEPGGYRWGPQRKLAILAREDPAGRTAAAPRRAAGG